MHQLQLVSPSLSIFHSFFSSLARSWKLSLIFLPCFTFWSAGKEKSIIWQVLFSCWLSQGRFISLKYRAIGLMSSVRRGSIPDQVISKTQKMVLDAGLLNTQHYKVWIKGKMGPCRERCSAIPYTSVYKLLKKEPSSYPRSRSPTLLYFIIVIIINKRQFGRSDQVGRMERLYIHRVVLHEIIKMIDHEMYWITMINLEVFDNLKDDCHHKTVNRQS